MEPVVGVDVAKGTSVIQAFTRRNEPYGKVKTILHEENGFVELGELLAELQDMTGCAPVVVLEATGHYHRSLVAYVERSGWKHYIVNPLQSKRAKGTQLRKVKTDAVDAWHLAEMYYRGDLKPHRVWDEAFTELQHVTRQHEFVTGLFVQAKLNTRALIDQVFPAYEKVFRDLFSVTSLKVLTHCLEGNVEDLQQVIQNGGAGKSRSKHWVQEKWNRLQDVLYSWKEDRRSCSQTVTLLGMVSLQSN